MQVIWRTMFHHFSAYTHKNLNLTTIPQEVRKLLKNAVMFCRPLFKLMKDSQSFVPAGDSIEAKIQMPWIEGPHHLAQLIDPAVHLCAFACCLDTLVDIDPA